MLGTSIKICYLLLTGLLFITDCTAQIKYSPLAFPAKRPVRVDAFDISEDGEWLASGGNDRVCVESLVDGHIVFSAGLLLGQDIKYVKLSPDKTKMAVFAGNFISIYDMVAYSRPFVIQVDKVNVVMFNNKDKASTMYYKKTVDEATKNCVEGEPQQVFKFIRSSLLYFNMGTAIEFYFNGNKNPVIKTLKGDYTYEPLKTEISSKFEFHYSVSPWLSILDSVKQCQFTSFLLDNTLSFAMVKYKKYGINKIEVWDLMNGTKKSSKILKPEEEEKFNKMHDARLDATGRYLYYYKENGLDRPNYAFYGQVNRMDLSNFSIEKLFDISDNKPVGRIRLSLDNKYIFCEIFDFNLSRFKSVQEFGLDENSSTSMIPKLCTFNLQNQRLFETKLNEPTRICFSNSSIGSDCYIGAGKNVYRLRIEDSSLRLINKSDGTPKVIDVHFEDTSRMFIVASDGIRRFNYYSLYQEAYYPIANVDVAAFKDSMVYMSDSNAVFAYNMNSGVQTPLYNHKKKVGGMVYHSLSGSLISSDYNNENPWSDSCAIYSVKVKSNKAGAIKILCTNMPVVKMVLSPDQVYLAVVTQTNQHKNEVLKTSNSGKQEFGAVHIFKYVNGAWTKPYIIDTNYEYFREISGSVAFSQDSKFVAYANSKLEIGIWDLKTGKKIALCSGQHGKDNDIRNYNVYKQANKLADFQSYFQINALVFQADGTLISAANDNKVCYWKKTGTIQNPSYTFKKLTAISTIVSGFTLSMDGRFMIVTGDDGNVSVIQDATQGFDRNLIMKKYTDGYTIYLNSGMYYSNQNGHDQIYFANNSHHISSEELDLYYNNPPMVSARTVTLLDIPKIQKRILLDYLQNLKDYKDIREIRFKQFNLPIGDYIAADDLDRPQINFVNRESLIKQRSTNLDSIKLDIRAFTAGEPIKLIHVWVNGVHTKTENDLAAKVVSKLFDKTVWIQLSPGDNRIQIACEDQKGMLSERKEMLIYKQNAGFLPDLYLVTLGVDQYDDPQLNLKYASKDCIDLINTFRSNKTTYRNIIVKSLLNRGVTIPALLNVKDILDKARPGDVVIVFYSGHGFHNQKKELFLGLSQTDLARKERTALPYLFLDSLLNTLSCRQRLLLLDACGSGPVNPDNKNITGNSKVQGAKGSFEGLSRVDSLFIRMKDMFPDLRPSNGTITIAATNGYQYAQETDSLQNGVFTYALLNAFKPLPGRFHNRADFNRDNEVDVSELLRFLKQAVFMINNKQTPTTRSVNLLNSFRIW